MKNYNKSDYAINKNRKGIVYRNADGSILEITFEKIAESNPEFTKEDFDKLKEFSDGIYHEQQKSDARYSNHAELNMSSDEIMKGLKMEFLEDAYLRQLDDNEFESKIHKIINKKLTATQRRRILMFMEGISTVKIAEIEGCNQNAVWKSIESAKKKIKYFCNF